MNTQFNSNVIWLQLEYKISTLMTVEVGINVGLGVQKLQNQIALQFLC